MSRRRTIPIDLVSSVSRSSGLVNGGDELTQKDVQEEYRDYIEVKMKEYRAIAKSESSKAVQENLLILFRKLREGIIASKRKDLFAKEVYETSFLLSIVFEASPSQIGSIMDGLNPNESDADLKTIMDLYHLKLNAKYLDCSQCWTRSLAKALRTNNFHAAANLLQPRNTPTITPDLQAEALLQLIESHRKQARERILKVLRVSHRQGTSTWLQSVLLFDNEDQWLRWETGQEHVKRKEGSDGIWLLIR